MSKKSKELYNTKIYKDTLAFALQAHGEQKTPENLPYSFHIVSVANEIINSLSMHNISYDEANIAIACALLHDVNEDTETKVSKCTLEIDYIDEITVGVEALTKNENLPTKQEQMRDSLERLKLQPYCVQMVKLADRITNLAPAPLFWNKAKREAYKNEAKHILNTLKDSNPYLSTKLQNKIDNYLVDGIKDNFGKIVSDDYLLFYSGKGELILDKSHKDYLKKFKAINRLNEYLAKKYDIELFSHWNNIEKTELQKYPNRVNINYIKDNLKNKLDKNIEKFMSIIDKSKESIE